MGEIAEILRPSWDAEKWIEEGWSKLSSSEKEQIKIRMDNLFKDGLPLKLHHDKLFYIYTFSMLAQLEVLAIQVPLKFKDKLTSPAHRERMHTQLLDEIFHGMVFTKIVYMLCEPHALPPAYNESIEKLCNFIREEDCPKVAVVLLNLIAEGWIEQIFYSLQRKNIAPEIFNVIIEDEHRHVSEADLYNDIGLPDMEVVRTKLDFLEEHLLGNVFLQYKYISSICRLLGMDEAKTFLQSLHEKHVIQLKKIKLTTSAKWEQFMETTQMLYPALEEYSHSVVEIPKTPMRMAYMTQWSDPTDPTMIGQFDMDVSCLQFFKKKYPPETLTTLILQSISHFTSKESVYRNFLNHKKIYQSADAYVGLVVKLPECGDHVGAVLFKNCHEMNIKTLSTRIRTAVGIMAYCYKRREQLEVDHPQLKEIFDEALYDFDYGFYPYPMLGCPFAILSNIGFTGYKFACSPLRTNEGLKFTLAQVERKLVWNKETDEFLPQDLLSVTATADHRIFDGYTPVPKLLAKSFEELFASMNQGNEVNKYDEIPNAQNSTEGLIEKLDKIMSTNLVFGYKVLTIMQTTWVDFMKLEEVFDQKTIDAIEEKIEKNMHLYKDTTSYIKI